MSDTIYARPGEAFYSELDNAPTGLVGTLGVRIIDKSDESIVLARTTAGIVESPAGSGRYKFTGTAPEMKGDYSVFWDTGEVSPGTTASDDLVVTHDPPVPFAGPGGYPSTGELVEASNLKALTELDETVQDGLRAEAILAVEAACRQSFTVEGADDEPVSRKLDGTGGDVLYLPKRLVELAGIEASGTAISGADVELSERHDRLCLPDPRSGSNWLTQTVSEATGGEHRAFPSGPAAVTVTGIWGWAPDEVPAAIATALRYDMEDRAVANAHALAETVRSARGLGVTGLSQGGLSLQMDGREVAVSTRVRRLLANAELIWHGPAGALA